MRMGSNNHMVQCRRPTEKHVSEYKPPNQVWCDISRGPLPFNALQDNAFLSFCGGELLLPFPRLSWSTKPATGGCSTHPHKLEGCNNSPGPKLFSHYKSLQPNNHLTLKEQKTHPPEQIYTVFPGSLSQESTNSISNYSQ